MVVTVIVMMKVFDVLPLYIFLSDSYDTSKGSMIETRSFSVDIEYA